MSEEEIELPQDGAIHDFFGLSYASYLVLNRTVLQSMPLDWQEAFVQTLRELSQTFPELDWPDYYVQVLARPAEIITRYEPCEECFDGHMKRIWNGKHYVYGEECIYCQGEGKIEEEDRYETPDEIGYIDDPIPNYHRGRTRVVPPGNEFKYSRMI